MEPSEFESRISRLDIDLFSGIPSQTTPRDRRSLLACQLALRQAFPNYTYLEIGSHLGGSLQVHVLDPLCAQIYSIDSRPLSQPDERGPKNYYERNSTARMMELLSELAGPVATKVMCLEGDTASIIPSHIANSPSLCFIDGEHTDTAVYRDFLFCLAVVDEPAVIAFHDAEIVYNGLLGATEYLRKAGIAYRSYHLPDNVLVIELGEGQLNRHPAIREILADNHSGYLESLRRTDDYRRFYNRRMSKFHRAVIAFLRSVKLRLRKKAS